MANLNMYWMRGAIPIVQSDRGGQAIITTGSAGIYMLIDVKRKKLNVRQLVTVLEQFVI